MGEKAGQTVLNPAYHRNRSDLRHQVGQASARQDCAHKHATVEGQVKKYARLPVVGLVPASLRDGRPPVFGSVASQGLPVCRSWTVCTLQAHGGGRLLLVAHGGDRLLPWTPIHLCTQSSLGSASRCTLLKSTLKKDKDQHAAKPL